MPIDLHAEIRDSLDAATKTIRRLSSPPLTPTQREDVTTLALIQLLDSVAMLARAVGVADAVETDPGAKPHVDTRIR